MNVDQLLIERVYSPIAGRMRHLFGLCQWRLAFECLNGSTAAYLAAVALEIASKGIRDGIFATMLRAMIWLLIMDRVRWVARRQAGSSVGVSSARQREWLFRIILVGVLPLSICYITGWARFLYTVALALLICHLYFKAADTPPPEPRRKLAFAHP